MDIETASREAERMILETAKETGKSPQDILCIFADLLKSEFEKYQTE